MSVYLGMTTLRYACTQLSVLGKGNAEQRLLSTLISAVMSAPPATSIKILTCGF